MIKHNTSLHNKISKLKQVFKSFHHDLQTLDSQNYGSWSKVIKSLMFILLAMIISALCWVVCIRLEIDEIKTAKIQHSVLQMKYQQAQVKSNEVDGFYQQVNQLIHKNKYDLALIPSDLQTLKVVETLNQLGFTNQIMINDIVIGVLIEQKQTLVTVIEQDIGVEATGTYHQLGNFVSQLLDMPRMISIHNFKLTPVDTSITDWHDPLINLSVTLKTYQMKAANPESMKDSKLVNK